jgi:hypothetical protein
MMVRKTWDRLLHLSTLVGTTVRRDLATRRARAADGALTIEGSGLRHHFDAAPPLGTRELPARAVPLQSPREHAQALLARVLTLLDAHGIAAVQARETTAAGSSVGIRREDWGRTARLLADRLETAVLGLADDRDASLAEYSARLSTAQLSEHGLMHVLDPAVTLHEGRVIARYGFETAVRLVRWDPTGDGRYAAAAWDPRTEFLAAEAFRPTPAQAPAASSGGEDALAPLREPALLEVDFPIDVVYTWVDGTDPAWLARKREALEADAGERMTEDAAADLRFVAHDELRHSLRSLERYAPWVRHVYLVTDRQRPAWLREDHPGLTVVDHTDIAPAGTRLPSFNSQAIEANLHRIDGLSEHFLYFNDDVFLSSPVTPELFFNPNGIASMYMSRAHVAPGPPVQGEPASDSAGKNARRLVHEATGRRVSRKLFHTPFALRRSVSSEIEERWPEVVAATRDAQFRRIDDVTLSGALHMNYAFATGRAVTRGIRYRYVNVGAPDAAERLAGLERDRDVLQTFCLNESTHEIDPAVLDAQVRGFLRRRFPDAASFEVPEAA